MLCSMTVITFGFVRAARTLSLSFICLLRLAHDSWVFSWHNTSILKRSGKIRISSTFIASPIIEPIVQFAVVGTNVTFIELFASSIIIFSLDTTFRSSSVIDRCSGSLTVFTHSYISELSMG